MTKRPLPEPDSEELFSILGPSVLRILYGWLYRRREPNPPTMGEVRLFMADAMGEPQEHIDRRLRELRRYFDIQAVSQSDRSAPRYQLTGWSQTPPPTGLAISRRVRAQVLAPQRCFQCGRTPRDDSVRLDVDHKVPQSWGGGNEPENLQPLCTDCNAGKRDYFQTYDVYADKIRLAINMDEPQKRIGELLRRSNLTGSEPTCSASWQAPRHIKKTGSVGCVIFASWVGSTRANVAITRVPVSGSTTG